VAWLIQSDSEGPVLVGDLGLIFTYKQIKNIDLIGRNNAERSADLKYLLTKKYLREIRKDASDDSPDPKLVQKLTETVQQAQTQVEAQNEQISELTRQNAELQSKMDRVLEEVKAFAKQHPIDIKAFAEAMRNAAAEKQTITAEKEKLGQEGVSEAEIKTQEKILSLKEKKLDKNLENLGKTISHSSEDYNDAIEALDKLGI
jgi:chromosome segregation ATPase